MCERLLSVILRIEECQHYNVRCITIFVQERKMKRNNTIGFIITATVLLVLCSSGSNAQTLTNKGSLIYLSNKAVVSCFGTFNVNAAGMVVVEDSAKLIVQGTMNISNGSLSLNKASSGYISQDLILGGICGTPSGTVIRSSPGILDVRGFVQNKGLITNSSLIRIGKDLNIDGDLNNLQGSWIDIGY